MLEEKMLFNGIISSLFKNARLYTAALVLASTSLSSAGCGGNEKEEKCETNADCLHQCIDYIIDADCNYTNPTPAQIEQCQEQGTQRCQEKYSSGRLYCGRSCRERTVPDCRNREEPYPCTRERTEAYCENACLQN